MSRAGLIATLVAVAFAGGWLWGRFAVAKERVRRVFFEWKKGRRAQRTLRKMLRRHAGQLVQAVAVLVLVAVVAGWLIARMP